MWLKADKNNTNDAIASQKTKEIKKKHKYINLKIFKQCILMKNPNTIFDIKLSPDMSVQRCFVFFENLIIAFQNSLNMI